MRDYSINAKHAINLEREDLLSPAVALGDINLYSDSPGFFAWKVEFRVERDGAANGVAGWFDCELAGNVWMSNSPLAQEPIQRPQAFLPISEAVPVKGGDTVKATIMARPADRMIAWVVEFPRTGQRFSQSTWQGMLLTEGDFVRANPGHVPRLSHEGRARLIVLGYCNGNRTAQEIAHAVLRDHPGLFPSQTEISEFVLDALRRDTQ